MCEGFPKDSEERVVKEGGGKLMKEDMGGVVKWPEEGL